MERLMLTAVIKAAPYMLLVAIGLFIWRVVPPSDPEWVASADVGAWMVWATGTICAVVREHLDEDRQQRRTLGMTIERTGCSDFSCDHRSQPGFPLREVQ